MWSFPLTKNYFSFFLLPSLKPIHVAIFIQRWLHLLLFSLLIIVPLLFRFIIPSMIIILPSSLELLFAQLCFLKWIATHEKLIIEFISIVFRSVQFLVYAFPFVQHCFPPNLFRCELLQLTCYFFLLLSSIVFKLFSALFWFLFPIIAHFISGSLPQRCIRINVFIFWFSMLFF